MEVQSRRLPTFDHGAVAALVSSGVYADLGCRNTAAVLVETVRLSPGEAASRVRAGKELGPRVDFTGGAMPPLYPVVSAAQVAGDISVSHARAVTSTVHKIPTAVKGEHAEGLERFLVDQAHITSPDQVTRIGLHALALIDPDGTLATDEDHQRLRGLTFTPNSDGSSTIRGRLTPQCAAVALAVLDPLAKPKPATPACTAADGTTTDGTTTVGAPDPRSYAQRMHDALLDAAKRLLAAGTLPDSGGVPATVLVTMTLTQLETRLGVATTGHGGLLSITAALNHAADAAIIPIVLTDTGGVIGYGRDNRHATPAQRRALAARDKGCSFPGCDAPPGWAETHHVIHWAHGGLSDLDNMTLVCGFHHREHQKMGWECHIKNGTPEWLPPWWIDPDRTPQHNRAHHLADYLLPVELLPDAA